MGETGDEELWATRPRRAGALSFFVTTATVDMQRLVEQLFQDLPLAEVADTAVEGFLLLHDEANPDRWQLLGPEVGALAGMSDADALAMLVTAVNLAALRAEPERLHLHAGAVVRDGRAVVMSAPRETGKTTTVARLVLRGWDFISDEAVSIGPDDDEVRGFPKPLSIKPQGRAWIPELRSQMVPAINEVADHEIVHVPLGAIGATAVPAAEPGLVVLLRRSAEQQPDARAASLPLHPADAVVHLMGETMDAGRFGPRAVHELARLVARCGCHELLVGDPDSTAEVIEELFGAPVERRSIQELEGGTRIPDHIVSLLIGDRVVIHEQPEGRILALDGMGSQIWLHLGGWPASQQLDLGEPAVAGFVQQLAELGLVQDHPSAESGSGPG